MKKILRWILISLFIGWLGNLALHTYRYRVVLRDFLQESNKPYLLLGSSRLYHNIDIALLHDSVHLIAKPNLYGIDVAHILGHLDLSRYRGVLVEYQPIHLSGGKNQVLFWDPRSLGFALGWCRTWNDYLQVIGNTFLWRNIKAQLTGFGLPPRLLDWPMSPYPDLQRQATWAVKKELTSPEKNLPFDHPLRECPNPEFYEKLRTQIPKNIAFALVYPFGHHEKISVCDPPADIPLFDLTQLPYTPNELFDDRHVNSLGAQRMTVAFNQYFNNWSLDLQK